MHYFFHFHRSWFDPVPGLNRALALIIAVLFVESSTLLFRGNHLPFPLIYLQGIIRIADILILLVWGPWVFKGPHISKAVKDALGVTLFFSICGVLCLTGWKYLSGSSMFLLGDEIFRQDMTILIVFYITSCLLSPIAEELLFRGILYRKLREKWNMPVSTLAVSTLFALIHSHFTGQALVPFLGSLIFCIGYEKNKFILSPILLHISGNLIIYLSPYISFI